MKPLRILLIEPDPDICGSVYTMLHEDGCIVATSKDIQILQHLDTFIHVDLILVDLDSETKYIPTIQALASDPRYAGRILPIICYCVDDHVNRMADAGLGQALVKPFDMDELRNRISAMMSPNLRRTV